MALKGRLSPHYRRENVSICNECGACIRGDVITHMTEAHCQSYFYTCHLCRNYSGYIRSSLFQHQRDKHGVSYYYFACPICLHYSSPKEKDVMTHVARIHSRSDIEYVCNYCSFRSKTDLEAHFTGTHSRYQCVFRNCQTVCQNSTHLFLHYIGDHFPNLSLFYSCSECDAMFPKKKSLFQHQRDKHDIEEDENEIFIELECPECSFTTWDKKNFEQHSINKHPYHFFNCTFMNCNYQSKLFRSIIQHTLDKHLSETFLRYECFECEEISYNKIHSLIQHLRDKHSVVHYCSLCQTYNDNLSEHILSVPDHSHYVFYCKICCEEYYEKNELIDHLSYDHVYISPLLSWLCFGDK